MTIDRFKTFKALTPALSNCYSNSNFNYVITYFVINDYDYIFIVHITIIYFLSNRYIAAKTFTGVHNERNNLSMLEHNYMERIISYEHISFCIGPTMNHFLFHKYFFFPVSYLIVFSIFSYLPVNLACPLSVTVSIVDTSLRPLALTA